MALIDLLTRSPRLPRAARWGEVDRDQVVTELADALVSLGAFVGAERITLGRVTPGRLRAPLRRAVTSSGTRSAPPSPPAPEP